MSPRTIQIPNLNVSTLGSDLPEVREDKSIKSWMSKLRRDVQNKSFTRKSEALPAINQADVREL